MKPIVLVEIPKYLTHVMFGKSRPANYYIRDRRIPMKYHNSSYDFNIYGVLVNVRTGKPVIANPVTAGKPKLKKINGRDFISGRISPVLRSQILQEMKRFYTPFFIKQKKIREACTVTLEIHNSLGDDNQDLDNMSWLLVKVLQDIFVETGILPEDNLHIIKGYEVKFVPIVATEERKLVVAIHALDTKPKMVLV